MNTLIKVATCWLSLIVSLSINAANLSYNGIDNGGVGDWETAENWNTNSLPATGDLVNINNNRTVNLSSVITEIPAQVRANNQPASVNSTGTFNMLSGSSISIDLVRIPSNVSAGFVNVSGGALTAVTEITVGSFVAASSESGPGTLTVNSGSVTTPLLVINTLGTVIVSGTAPTMIQAGAVTTSTGSSFDFDLDASGVDSIDVTGLLTLASGANISVDGSAYAGGDLTTPLLNFGSLAGDFSTANISVSGFTAGYTVNVVPGTNSLDLVITGSAGSTQWGSWDLDQNSWADTTDRFLGYVNVSSDPWIYSLDLANFIYMPESNIAVNGAWGYIFSANLAGDEWSDWGVDPNSWVDTGEFLGTIYVGFAPWIYSVTLDNFIYMPEANLMMNGAWGYIKIKPAPVDQ